jgi:hypothetical protein
MTFKAATLMLLRVVTLFSFYFLPCYLVIRIIIDTRLYGRMEGGMNGHSYLYTKVQS